MRTALNRSPVSILHPVTEQYVTVKRGDEFDDDHPFTSDKNHAWIFEETPDEAELKSVPIESATRAPGETRRNRQR